LKVICTLTEQEIIDGILRYDSEITFSELIKRNSLE